MSLANVISLCHWCMSLQLTFCLFLQLIQKQIMAKLDKVTGIGKKKEVRKLLKNAANLKFLKVALDPFLEVQDTVPVLLRVWKYEPPVLRTFVPYHEFFSIDAAEGNSACGLTFGTYKCRKCELLPHFFDADFVPKPRMSQAKKVMQKFGQRAWKKKILRQQMSEYIIHIKHLNIANIVNPLHAHFSRGNRDLCRSVL